MAAATTALIVGGAVMAGAGAAKSITGAKQAKKARKAIENYEYQELTNAYSNLAPSTAGAELQAETIARQSATMTEQASKLGARGVAMSGQIAEMETQGMRQIAATLDQQQAEYDRLIAAGEMERQQMIESRSRQELAGLGQMYNVGQQNLWGGIGDIVQGGLTAGAGLFGGGGLFGSAQAQAAPPLAPTQSAYQHTGQITPPSTSGQPNQFM